MAVLDDGTNDGTTSLMPFKHASYIRLPLMHLYTSQAGRRACCMLHAAQDAANVNEESTLFVWFRVMQALLSKSSTVIPQHLNPLPPSPPLILSLLSAYIVQREAADTELLTSCTRLQAGPTLPIPRSVIIPAQTRDILPLHLSVPSDLKRRTSQQTAKA